MEYTVQYSLSEFLRAKPKGTPYAEGLYLTVDLELSSNTESNLFLKIIMLMIPSLFSLTISQYTPWGVYCEIYSWPKGYIEEFNMSIPLLRMIHCTALYWRAVRLGGQPVPG